MHQSPQDAPRLMKHTENKLDWYVIEWIPSFIIQLPSQLVHFKQESRSKRQQHPNFERYVYVTSSKTQHIKTRTGNSQALEPSSFKAIKSAQTPDRLIFIKLLAGQNLASNLELGHEIDLICLILHFNQGTSHKKSTNKYRKRSTLRYCM